MELLQRLRQRYLQFLQVVVDVLKESYDYVIVNAASTGTADGDAAVSVANSVLLAVISSQTTHNQVAAALDRFGGPFPHKQRGPAFNLFRLGGELHTLEEGMVAQRLVARAEKGNMIGTGDEAEVRD